MIFFLDLLFGLDWFNVKFEGLNLWFNWKVCEFKYLLIFLNYLLLKYEMLNVNIDVLVWNFW